MNPNIQKIVPGEATAFIAEWSQSGIMDLAAGRLDEFSASLDALLERAHLAGYEARDREVRDTISAFNAEIVYANTGEPRWREYIYQKMVKDIKRKILEALSTHLTTKV